jgi:hypothetical protein
MSVDDSNSKVDVVYSDIEATNRPHATPEDGKSSTIL